MLYTDIIYFFELELFSINSKSECFDKRLFGNNCLNVYFPRFASTTPIMKNYCKLYNFINSVKKVFLYNKNTFLTK